MFRLSIFTRRPSLSQPLALGPQFKSSQFKSTGGTRFLRGQYVSSAFNSLSHVPQHALLTRQPRALNYSYSHARLKLFATQVFCARQPPPPNPSSRFVSSGTTTRRAGCRGITHPPANPHRYRLRAEQLETPRMRSRTVGPSQQALALHGIRPLCKDPSRGSSSSSHKVPSGASSTSSNITLCHSPRGFTVSTIHDSYQTRRSRL